MRSVWKRLVCYIAFCFMIVLSSQHVEAASTKSVTGICRYDEAYDVLTILNQKRAAKGLGKLKMDKHLLEAAMTRAAEITISFDHYRPNGEICFTVCDKMYAENIAYGYGDAAYVMSAWMGSSGHYTNMMNSDYKSVGVGCFYKDGVKYWVQCFGYASATKISEPSNLKRTYKVSLSSGTDTTIANSNPLATRVQSVKATAGNRKLTVKWKKKNGISGYQIQISTSKSFKKRQTFTVGKGKTKYTITKFKGSKLKAKKKYYIRIRAYKQVTNDNGTVIKKYSKWKTISKTTK